MAGEAKREGTVTALVHLYRGEVARADTWRARLDNTTNWALTTTAAVISFGLGSASASHAVFLVGMFLVLNFLLIEARRYRTWDVYLRRVRMLEVGLYAPLLRDEPLDPGRLRELAAMLSAPRIVIPYWVALGQRIKRAYGPVLGVLLAAWVVKLFAQRRQLGSLAEFIDRAHIGLFPGGAIMIVVLVLYVSLGGVLAWSFWVSPPATELRASPTRWRKPLRAAFERAGQRA